MLFHRCQDAEVALNALGVVIANIVMNHLCEAVFAGKSFAIIAFPFQNAPETLYRTVINAMCHTRHALRHSSLHELVVESAAGILKASVAVE